MNHDSNTPQSAEGFFRLRIGRLIAAFNHIPDDLILLAARISMGAVFLLSGRTKMAGWQVSENAVFLFQEEYRVPLLDPFLAAHLAAYAEHLLPLLLFIGLGTRFAALALLAMTAVIQFLVYPDAWPTHASWACLLLLILARGPGNLSMDALLFRQRK